MTPLYVTLFIVLVSLITAYFIAPRYSKVRELLGALVAGGLQTAVLAIAGILFSAVVGLLLAFPVKLLWNEVVPQVLGFKYLDLGQAWCLVFLSALLFGNSGLKVNTD